MVAGHTKHFMAALAQPFEEATRLLELLGTGALGEVAADDDQVGLEYVDRPLDAFDQPLVVSAEMEVGKMDEARHPSVNASSPERFTRHCERGEAIQSRLDCRIADAPRNDV